MTTSETMHYPFFCLTRWQCWQQVDTLPSERHRNYHNSEMIIIQKWSYLRNFHNSEIIITQKSEVVITQDDIWLHIQRWEHWSTGDLTSLDWPIDLVGKLVNQFALDVPMLPYEQLRHCSHCMIECLRYSYNSVSLSIALFRVFPSLVTFTPASISGSNSTLWTFFRCILNLFLSSVVKTQRWHCMRRLWWRFGVLGYALSCRCFLSMWFFIVSLLADW